MQLKENSFKSSNHERLESDRLIQEVSDLKFGGFLVGFLLLVSFFGRRADFISAIGLFFAAICGGFLIFAPKKLRSIKRLWIKIGEILSRLMTPIVLTVFYFLVFAPFALILRFCRVRNSFSDEKAKTTYWHRRDTQREQDHLYFKQQF